MPLSDFKESDASEWRITWTDTGGSRTTTLAAIAWFADEHDEEAEVEEL